MKKILLILLSIFFLSCGVKNSNDNEHIFYLDNPSNEDIEIILDSSKNITTITISNTSFFTLSPPLKRDVRGKNGILLYHKT